MLSRIFSVAFGTGRTGNTLVCTAADEKRNERLARRNLAFGHPGAETHQAGNWRASYLKVYTECYKSGQIKEDEAGSRGVATSLASGAISHNCRA
jgi:hypothetical protein